MKLKFNRDVKKSIAEN